MVEMVVRLNPRKYGRLCSQTLPKVIASEAEFDHMAEQLEALEMKPNPSPEETALAALLTKLIEDYDEIHYPLPDLPPHKMLAYLMGQRGLKQAGLVDLIGSR